QVGQPAAVGATGVGPDARGLQGERAARLVEEEAPLALGGLVLRGADLLERRRLRAAVPDAAAVAALGHVLGDADEQLLLARDGQHSRVLVVDAAAVLRGLVGVDGTGGGGEGGDRHRARAGAEDAAAFALRRLVAADGAALDLDLVPLVPDAAAVALERGVVIDVAALGNLHLLTGRPDAAAVTHGFVAVHL